MMLSVEELGIRVVLMHMTIEYPNYPIISLLTQPREIVWTCCDWEIQVFTSGLELEFSPPQLNVLPLSYDVSISWWNCTFRTLILKYIYLTNPKSCERPVYHSVSISRCLVKLYLSRLDPDNSLDLGPHSIVWYQCGNYRLNLHSIPF